MFSSYHINLELPQYLPVASDLFRVSSIPNDRLLARCGSLYHFIDFVIADRVVWCFFNPVYRVIILACGSLVVVHRNPMCRYLFLDRATIYVLIR